VSVTDVFHALPDVPPVSAVRAHVAKTITALTDLLFVTVPAFDGGRQLWGPCKRVPGNALPIAGEECLLVLTQEDGTPWVLLSTLLYTDTAGQAGQVLVARAAPQIPDWQPTPPPLAREEASE
jgi:hypothetical protein